MKSIKQASIIKAILNDNKAQLSIEYLIMIIFGMLLMITTGIVLININSLVTRVKADILTARDELISNL
ncbi:MAG: hypothetical protein V1824_01515 [archaeon]